MKVIESLLKFANPKLYDHSETDFKWFDATQKQRHITITKRTEMLSNSRNTIFFSIIFTFFSSSFSSNFSLSFINFHSSHPKLFLHLFLFLFRINLVAQHVFLMSRRTQHKAFWPSFKANTLHSSKGDDYLHSPFQTSTLLSLSAHYLSLMSITWTFFEREEVCKAWN